MQYYRFLPMVHIELSAAENVMEEPLLVIDDDKPFNMKKFRDSLRKPDCIMGTKRCVCVCQRQCPETNRFS